MAESFILLADGLTCPSSLNITVLLQYAELIKSKTKYDSTCFDIACMACVLMPETFFFFRNAVNITLPAGFFSLAADSVPKYPFYFFSQS